MIILGINSGYHNSSVALLKNNKIIFHIENERLSNIKYDKYVFQAIEKVKDYVEYVDHVVFTGFEVFGPVKGVELTDSYIAQILGLNKTFFQHGFQVHNYFNKHHETHAATAFYNSGFDEALCIVMDGSGSSFMIEDKIANPNKVIGWEVKSVYNASYPNNFELLEKYVASMQYSIKNPYKINDNLYLLNNVSEGDVFEYSAEMLGFTQRDAGKVMGLALYGSYNIKYPSIYKDGYIDKKYITIKNNNYTLDFIIDDNFQDKADFAYRIQKDIESNVAEYILKMINKTKAKNICLSGGLFLNCVSNYNLLKQLESNVNLYVEPICSDAGNAIGAAKEFYYSITQSKEKIPQNNIYYGPQPSYNLNLLDGQKIIKEVSPSYIAQLISEKNIVALYQGSSESGPRALGNRSILYDPRDPDGKNHVNIVKKRESFRPFAGTVLLEYAKDWFNLYNLSESKYMMFAVDVIEDKKDKIPAITHVDGTCRIQTLKKEDNENYYNIIEEFYKITGVPILFNTSLNLAGDAINESFENVLNTFKQSEINYLYLPELKILVIK